MPYLVLPFLVLEPELIFFFQRAPSGFSPWTPHDASLTSTQTDADGPLTLVGTLLAHNAAFEKHLSVHFTLDGWSTTSDVCARYVDAGTAVHPPSPCSPPPFPGPGWDRFAFHIPLADYAGKDAEMGGLCARELALAVRFTAPYVRADGVAPYIWCGQCWFSPCLASALIQIQSAFSGRTRTRVDRHRRGRGGGVVG